jgi:hypothetical protein
MIYHPSNWYWLADDGRVYSGPKQQPVESTDEDYLAYVSEGQIVRPWPRDIDGEQTTAALQDVLTPYGMFADLKGYAASVRYAKEVAGCEIGGVTYPSDRETQAKLTAAALFAQVDNAQTFQWKLAAGSFSESLSAAQMIAVAAAVGGYVNACFAQEAGVVAEIDSGTITTREEIDAAFA